MHTSLPRISILGTGWLGHPLAKHLKSQGYTLKLATRSAERLAQLSDINDDNYQIDLDKLNNSDALKNFLAADILIINITYKNKQNYQQFVEQIAQSDIKNVLFVSSSSVYKNTQSVVTESAEFEDPDNIIFQIEQLFKNYSSFQSTFVRMAGLVDSRRHPGRFFKSGKIIPQAEAPINLIHLDDCIGVIDAVIQQQAWGEVFNACSTTHPNKRKFYNYVRGLLNQPSPTFSDDSTLSYKIVSNDKIRQQLGYHFIHPDLMQCTFQ